MLWQDSSHPSHTSRNKGSILEGTWWAYSLSRLKCYQQHDYKLWGRLQIQNLRWIWESHLPIEGLRICPHINFLVAKWSIFCHWILWYVEAMRQDRLDVIILPTYNWFYYEHKLVPIWNNVCWSRWKWQRGFCLSSG